MMKALLLFGFMFSLQSQALVPQSVYLNATTLGHLTGTYVLASATEAGKVVYHKTGTDYKIYWTPTSEGFWLVGTFIPGLHYTSELSIASDADIPPKTGWTGGRTLSYTYERSIFAHRPDLTPEPVVFTAEMPVSLWTNSLLWLTAESPVLNEGATNANWISYSKTSSGNPVQPVLDKQPGVVTTNGIKAFFFDGQNDFMTAPHSDELSLQSGGTVMAWVNPSDRRNYGGVLAKAQDGGTVGSYAFILYNRGIDQDFRYLLGGTTSAVSAIVSQDLVPLNDWTHICGTHDGSDVIFYVNAVAQTNVAQTVTPMNASSQNLRIGAGFFAEGAINNAHSFPGLITEPYIFSRPLPPEEIEEYFNWSKARYGK
jgi:hypothetical protein